MPIPNKTVSVTVNIKKSPIPIVWIDTSLVINFTKIRLGIKLQNPLKNWTKNLYHKLADLSKSGKVICPFADQDDEIWAQRDECLETINTLALGIHVDSILSVRFKLFDIFAKSFVRKESTIDLDYSIIFNDDPINEMQETIRNGYFITTKHPLYGGADTSKRIRDNLAKQLNLLREKNVENNVSKEEQLEHEYKAELYCIADSLKYREHFVDQFDYDNFSAMFENTLRMARHWREICLESGSNDYYLDDYFNSSHYKAVPSVNIKSHIYATLLTRKQTIKQSEVKDVEYISNYLPFVDFFITDKERRRQINKMGFSSEYSTKACYIGDQKSLNAYLDSLQ